MITLEILDAINYLQKRIEQFFIANKSWNYLLIGNPGTGKSCAVKFIAKKMNLKTLRVKISSFITYGNAVYFDFSSFETIVKIAKPDLIIIDDIDRISNQDSLLHTIEFVKNYSKTVIATANLRNKINSALMRVGRFDDVLDISEMEENVVRSIVGEDEEQENINKFKKWPIAYVINYADRKKILGKEPAQKEIELLEKRVIEVGLG